MAVNTKSAQSAATWLWVSWHAVKSTLKAFFHVGLGWLVPLIIVILLIALFLAVLASTGALAPLVYPLV